MPEKESRLHLRGDVEIRVRDRRTGAILKRVQTRNKIMQGGLNALAALLAQKNTGAPASDGKLTELRVGTGLLTPTAQDASLAQPVAGGVASLSDANVSLSEGRLTVQATLPTALNENPVALSEAGLFLADGTLFARQVHTTVTTGAGLLFDYTWVLTFTA